MHSPSPLPQSAVGLLKDSVLYDAAGDRTMIRRVGALTWLLTGGLAIAMLSVWRPTFALGALGWPVAAVLLSALMLAGGVTLLRSQVSLAASLTITLGSIVVLGVMTWLAGPKSEYLILIALPVMFVAAAQAPLRVGAAVIVAGVVEFSVTIVAPSATETVAAAVLRLIVWAFMAALALIWTAGVRWQRMALRAEEAHAHHLALHDPVTALGNRRKLMADLEAAAATGRRVAIALFDLNGFKAYNDSFGHPAGDALLVRLSAQLSAAAAGVAFAYRMGGDEFCLLSSGGQIDGEELVKLGATALTERGQGFLISAAGGAATLPDEAPDPVAGLRLADGRMYAEKHERRGRATTDGAQMLLAILQERDPGLSAHCEAVADLAGTLADRLGIAGAERSELVWAARLHDIGKLAIPDAILCKPGPLDEEEWAFIRRHTVIGERVMSSSSDLAPVARIVRASHERFDGRGYPDELRGEGIPLAARVVAICDAYDAMSSTRAYRPALTREEILGELRRGSGTQFDPRVAAELIATLTQRAAEAPSLGS
jgi:two-component system cell cycle response regulator